MRLLFLLTLTVLGSALAQALPSLYPPLAGDARLEAELLVATNGARAAAGLAPLAPDEQLALAARHHALEMATLSYFSHTSPRSETATAALRAARAGSPYITLGENLAQVGSADVAPTTTQGWLDSPGHRANLLNPTFSHVGFGTAHARDGGVIVVQLLAYEPIRLTGAKLSTRATLVHTLTLTVVLDAPAETVFRYGEQTSSVLPLAAGTNTVTLKTFSNGRIHLQGAVAAPTGDGFILEDSGWLDLASGTFASDGGAPRQHLQIEGARVIPRSSTRYTIDLRLAGSGDELAVFMGDRYVEGATAGPGHLRFDLDASDAGVDIAVGQALAGGQIQIVLGLGIEVSTGRPRLIARALY